MSSIVTRKRTERLKLAREIESSGVEMNPCSHCQKQNRKCVLDNEKSSRCAECVRSKKACDGKASSWEANVPSMGDWESIARQKAKLEDQEEEAMAKILRLRKQRKFLLRREAEMTKRGLKFLDELDAAEENEKKNAEEKAVAAQIVQSEGDLLATDNRGLAIADDLFTAVSPSFWMELGVPDGNRSASQG